MIWFNVIILALIQGIAEFLPISSSGHLAVLGAIFGFNAEEGLSLGIILHAGSLLAILAFYFKTLIGFFRRDQLHLLWMVLLGSIPAGVFGVLLKATGWDERLFGDMTGIAFAFLVTGMLLRLTGKQKLTAGADTELKAITPRQALLTGLAQMVAILPGISRSGSTISVGIFSGVKREAAGTFSFLLALPAIGGAALLETLKLYKAGGLGADESFTGIQLAVGLVISALTSFGALAFLVKLIQKGRLALFSWYLFALGTGVLVWQIVKAARGI